VGGDAAPRTKRTKARTGEVDARSDTSPEQIEALPKKKRKRGGCPGKTSNKVKTIQKSVSAGRAEKGRKRGGCREKKSGLGDTCTCEEWFPEGQRKRSWVEGGDGNEVAKKKRKTT